jgi:hypothetical protein
LSKTFSHKQAIARIGPGFDAYRRLVIEPLERREMEPQDVFLHLVKKKLLIVSPVRPSFLPPTRTASGQSSISYSFAFNSF